MKIEYYKKYEPIFGSWYIDHLIGEGSFGQVYEIIKTEAGVTYKSALKAATIPRTQHEVCNLINNNYSYDDIRELYWSMVEQSISECLLMSKLKGSQNIVCYEEHQVIEHDDDIGWDIFIRMELLTPLSDYFLNQHVTYKDIVKLGIDICKALEICYSNNILHRDIKAENIFVSEQGDYMLGDFGTAILKDKAEASTSIMGTFGYMAPEVYNGEAYGFSADLYSLGLLLYRLLNCNRMPFLPEPPAQITIEDNQEALAKRMKGEKIPKLQNCPEELAEIVIRSCSYHSKDRYSSPTVMRRALEALLYSKDKIFDDIELYLNDYTPANFRYLSPKMGQTIRKKKIKMKSHNKNTVLYSYIENMDRTELINNKSNPDINNTAPNSNIPDDMDRTVSIPISKNTSQNDNTIITLPQKSNCITRSTVSKIWGKIIEWILFTCILSLLPLIVFSSLSFCFSSNSEDNILVSELLFFGMTISIITIRDLISHKLWKHDKNIFNIALFFCIFVLIMSSILYGIITLNNLSPHLLDIDVYNGNLMLYSLTISIISFIGGTAVQIWEVV